MVKFAFPSVLVLASLSLLAANASGQIRCFTNDDGIWTCSESFSPEDARHDREIRNSQGITIGREEGEITPEEQREIDRLRLEEEEQARLEEESRQYDKMLLEVYLNDTDIENLRDRRLDLMNSQVRLTEIYLGNLREKLEGLMRRAARFAPYSDREAAAPIPENLARDIDQTESSIAVRENTLQDITATQERIRIEFGRDIARFREIKGY